MAWECNNENKSNRGALSCGDGIVGRVLRHAGKVVWLQCAEEQAGSTVDAAMQSTGKGGKGRQGWGRRIINKTNLLGNMVDE